MCIYRSYSAPTAAVLHAQPLRVESSVSVILATDNSPLATVSHQINIKQYIEREKSRLVVGKCTWIMAL